MEAKAVNLGQLVRQEICYTLPLFQRKYVWDKTQWAKLWEDIEFLCEHTNAADHFLGSVVCIQMPSIAGSVPEMMLIDGQQRLTSLFVILIVLRDSYAAQNNPEAQRINGWIINQYETGINKYKLQPTEKDKDRSVFFQLIDKQATTGNNQIWEAYQYFSKEINKAAFNLADIMNAVIGRLKLVSIGLSQEENPNLVFESLNSTGRKLYASDLIRNYFFMKMPAAKQTAVYNSHWLPIEEKFNDEELTEFIRHYLKRDGSIVRMSNIYMELKARVKEDILTAMEELGRYAHYYQRLLKPEYEPNKQIRYYLERLQILDTTTAYPFLLNCYEMITNKELSETEFVSVLNLLENYIIRRLVCERPSGILDKSFSSLHKQANGQTGQNFVVAISDLLSKKDYPNNALFTEYLTQKPMYAKAGSAGRIKFLLLTLDQKQGKKEHTEYTNASIEHIMPQTLDKEGWWKEHLGADYELIHQTYLHRLGNLTLSADNGSLSNHSFEDKKAYLANHSRMLLNNYFSKQSSWREADISKRGKYLAEQCLEIWGYFGETEERSHEITHTVPHSVSIKGSSLSLEKQNWKSVLQAVCLYIYNQYPERIAALISEYPNQLSKDGKRTNGGSFLDARQIADGFYVETNLSADGIAKLCGKFLSFVGIKETEWQVERIAKA